MHIIKIIVKAVSHDIRRAGDVMGHVTWGIVKVTWAIIIHKDKFDIRIMESLVQRLALRIKMHNISGSIVHHVALLKKALGQQGEIIKGFCVIMETKEVCEHYWVRVDGLDLDVAFAVAKLRNPELQALCPVLLESCPPGLIHSDADEVVIREVNSKLFELYQQDPKAFWRESPRDVRSFRVN